MVESLINRRMVIFITLIIMLINILLYIGDIHDGILPKFISSSYKEDLKFEFNSIFLNRIFNIVNKFIKINNLKTSFLIGDLPIYPSSKNLYDINHNYKNDNILIQNIKNDLYFTDKIPMATNSKYFLFPNYDKTKINIVIFSLEKIKDINNENIIFHKLSQISLYEIPIHNFIINYQSEFDLKKSFFKLKWKINLSGVITKYSFSNDYEQLCVVFKNITNNKEIRYNIAYINLNNNDKNFYNIIELEGNLKIESLAVLNNIIVYSRKYDLYKINILVRDKDSNKWINLSKIKKNPIKEPYNKIDRLKFISKNYNNTKNAKNESNNDIYLFMKGILCNEKGAFLYMQLLNLDLNLLNYKLIKNEHLDISKNISKSDIIYIEENENKNKSIIKESIIFYNLSIFPSLFEKKKLNLEKNYTYNIENLELDKLSLNFKDIHSYTIFNKYLQKKEDKSFLVFHHLSNLNTYSTFFMNSSFFYDIKSNDYNEDEFIIKTDQNFIKKICGKDDNYIIELNDDKLFYSTKMKPFKNNQDGEIIETRRISFLSVPNAFKPKKIYDFYFDFFDNKYILILLIDDGVLLSLDFTKSIEKKNNAAVFYMDIISNKKIIMITINFFFLFLYSLDWSHFDQISINIRDMIVDFINDIDSQITIENNLPNRFDIRDLNLSNSSLSLLSNASNDLNEDNNNNVLNNMELNENDRLRSQRSVIEDLLGVFPY